MCSARLYLQCTSQLTLNDAVHVDLNAYYYYVMQIVCQHSIKLK